MSYRNACFINNELGGGLRSRKSVCEQFRDADGNRLQGLRCKPRLTRRSLCVAWRMDIILITAAQTGRHRVRNLKGVKEMIVTGEKLNSSDPFHAGRISEKRRKRLSQGLPRGERKGGAPYLDINTGMCDDEPEMLKMGCGL